MKNRIIISVSLFFGMLLVVTPLFAQLPSLPDDTANAPVDGGLSLLIAGGVGYGVKKMRQNRKKNTTDNI